MAVEIDLPLAPDADADRSAARLAAELTEVGNEGFLRAVLHDPVAFHHRSSERHLAWHAYDPDAEPDPDAKPEPDDSLLLRALHTAFAAHLPLSLSPDLLWYTIVHEVAVHVRLDADTYAGLFGATPGEQRTVTVQDDFAEFDWGRSLHLVREPLAATVGAEATSLLLPAFSTTTPSDSAAALVALMDVVSPYVRFEWVSLCGIPRIRLEGTSADWALLASRARELADRFHGLRPWFDGLQPVLDTIAAAAAGQGVDEEFWRSIYKYRSRSGGATVTGWINAFFAHRYSGEGATPKQEFGPGAVAERDFPTHISRVPFRWQTPDRVLDMAHVGGVFGVERDGEWLRPRLGHAVVELLPRTGPLDPRLPERWQLADIRRVTGRPEARILDTVFQVHDEDGDIVEADLAIELEPGLLLLRTVDGRWHSGELRTEPGHVSSWGPEPDLVSVLRSV